jgi:hypothetical protein
MKSHEHSPKWNGTEGRTLSAGGATFNSDAKAISSMKNETVMLSNELNVIPK